MIKQAQQNIVCEDWKSLPLPIEIKDLLIGRTCFLDKDKEVLNFREGLYSVLPMTSGQIYDQIGKELSLLIMDKTGAFYQFVIK